MFTLPVLFVLAILLLVFYTFNLNKQIPKNFPPGPPRLPVWGSYWFIIKKNFRHTYKAILSFHETYKTDVVGLWLGPASAVSCYKYELVKEMLTRDEFTGRGDNCIVRNRGFGRLLGIFFTDGPFWKDQRWFSLRHMRDYGFGKRDEEMENVAISEVKRMIEFFTSKPKENDSDVCKKKGVVMMPDIIYGPAVNCILHSLSSTHFENYRELREIGRTATRFLKCIDGTGNSICITPWLKNFAPEYFGWNASFREHVMMFNFVRKVIDEHKKTYIRNQPRDFIDNYLDELNYLKETKKTNTSFEEENMVYVVVDYMFPSPAAIGHALNYIFANLIHRPEMQKKIHDEIDSVIGRSRLPNLDDRQHMHYMAALVRESMRKDTLVPLGLARRAIKDTTLGGYFIPKDTIMIPNLWAMHNDPAQWGDPENFRPERHLDENGHILKKDETLPFGGGKRGCAGQTFARNTMFLFMTGILQNFTLKTPKGEEMPNYGKQSNGLTLSLPCYWMETVPR